MLIIYCPFPDQETALKTGKHLIESQLAACCQQQPVTSQFIWNKKFEQSTESILIVKTLRGFRKKILKEIRKMHPYEVPCIAHWEVSVNKSYYDWIKQSLGNKK